MPMLGVGVDQAWDRASVADLLAYKATFVCRYLGEDVSGKNLTKGEADAYIAAGIAVVSNYEYSPGAALRGYSEGVRVARLADAQHRACGGPAGRPIYFSVDIDITNPTQMAAVRGYFRGIASVIGVARTGAYGEYDVIRDLFDNGLIRWGWQTYAWSSGRWDSRAQIRQVANGIQVAGHDVDRNEQWAPDFGQWPYGGDDMAGEVADAALAQLDGRNALGQAYTRLFAGSEEQFTADVRGRANLRAIREAIDGLPSKVAASGQPTQDQVDAAILKAMQDPAVQKGIGDAIASHLRVVS